MLVIPVIINNITAQSYVKLVLEKTYNATHRSWATVKISSYFMQLRSTTHWPGQTVHSVQ